jgi:hypothetical protein
MKDEGVASKLSRHYAELAMKRQKEKKEGSTAANSGLLRGTVVIDAKIFIPSCVNMKDMDGVISLVCKLVPSIPKRQLDRVPFSQNMKSWSYARLLSFPRTQR